MTRISEIAGLVDGQVQLRDLIRFEFAESSDEFDEKVEGKHCVVSDLPPAFLEKVRYFGEYRRLTDALQAGRG